MNTLIQHAKLAIRMNNNGINREFIKKFPIEEIIDCCNRIEQNKILNDEYKDNEVIQEEIIKDEKFIHYLNIAYKKDLDMVGFEELLIAIKQHNEKMTDYSIKDILNVLYNKELFYKSYYDYLKYFRNESISLKKRITNNLNHFHCQSDIEFNELSENERKLVTLLDLDDKNLIPTNVIKEIYELLLNNEELRNIIDFLNAHSLYIQLDEQDYKVINNNAKEIKNYIKSITDKINNDDITYRMLLKWVGKGCSVYDLKSIEQKISKVETEKLESIFSNRSSYINFIYGNKLKEFPLDSIYGTKEELIIYAISNNKKNFLKLIQNNMNDFLSIPSNSILYSKNFYTKYINLNELTLKHLNKLKLMDYHINYNIDYLKEQLYTFEEINTLFSIEKQYIKLYNELLSLPIDDRLLRIRQFIKKDLLKHITNDDRITKLADKIRIKPLYTWLEDDFNRIEGIKASDIIEILINYDAIEKLLPEITKQNELTYILRNISKLDDYSNLQSIKDNIENFDDYWSNLKDAMQFSEEFVVKYKENIKTFLLNNGSELAYLYYLECDKEHRESFKLIIKAELMNEFRKLKYHTNDLNKEIDFELNNSQITEWTENNSKIVKDKYDIGEYDDFYYTMILGEYPEKTCLSYRDGGYNKCLLACFDSNKKVLYAKINNKIVARAMVRLTKGSYNKEKGNNKSINFIDVEESTQEELEDKKEYLTLFLEKAYISGINEGERNTIKKLFIKLLKEKAKAMNALLVLSCNYKEEIDEQFISTRYYMYISKSKAGTQYLDSLSGQATISDEGQYKVNTFLIWQPKEDGDSIFEGNIF